MIILYPQQDNKLAVVVPCTSLEQAISTLPDGVPYKIVDLLDIINEFFDAYEFDQNKGAILNIKKAKEIKLNQFRCARKCLLEKLDVDYIRAVEDSNAHKKKSITAKKQQLRDVTNIELPDDATELIKFWPDVLKGA